VGKDGKVRRRPDIFIGHYGAAEDAFVSARISGIVRKMILDPRST
jgi:hypothetical protein